MKVIRPLMMVLLVLAAASVANAQIATGNIYGSVSDQQGARLQGVTVTLTSKAIGSRATVTDEVGQFRFLNIDKGTYTLSVTLSGFTTQEREVIVTTGVNTEIPFSLKVSQVAETITVTAASPIVDTKKIGTATTLSTEELQNTPQSRDPWAVLKTVPGVIVDRVNVGGNESGQQSGFVGKGATFADTMWNLDGVVITDTTSGGASSSYFDFDAFDEVAINTGGNDLKVQTGGIGINFVTKRGTNEFKGSARVNINNDAMESSNLPAELKGDARLKGADKANHTDQILDRGFDIGGPIIKDKLWFWGSYGKQDIRIIRLTQTNDRTVLTNKNAKINWAATSKDQVSGFYFNGAKEKFGRSPGQASNEADSFLWNQGNFYPETGALNKLHGLWKVEDNHVVNNALFINGKYAYYGWGYGFAPRGGTDKDGGIDYDADRAYGSWFTYIARKPWHIVDVSGSAFKNSMGGSHEFKFGFGYRRNPNASTTRWSGSQVVGVNNGPGASYALAYRERVVSFTGQNYDVFVGDTFSRGPLTVNAGIRWDRQESENSASTAKANPTFPTALPEIKFQGGGPSIDWKNVSPRVSMTYALDEARKTILRASYARYAGQLNPFEVTASSPVGGYYTFIAYNWVDTNGDHLAQRGEILNNLGPQYSNNIDPAKPTSLSSVNTIDPNYHANHDDEFIVGLDRELIPNLSVGGAYTYRRGSDFPSFNPRIGLTSADYTGAAFTSGAYSGTIYSPNAAKVNATGGGRILTNRQDYSSAYNGFELTMNKRLADKWMARVAFSYMDWVEHPGKGSVQNPTRTDSPNTSAGGGFASGPQVDGGQIAPRSGGSGKGDIFYNAHWQINANGLYQIKGGIDVAAGIFGHQGYARPFIYQATAGADGRLRVVVTPNIDDHRYPNLWDVDFRVAKTVSLQRVRIVLSGDVFNALNNDVETVRNRQVNAAAFGQLNEIISPRILRIGLRFQF